MKSVPSSLQAKLASHVTTLCACWRLVRRDGVVMGFTDHDRDISFAGVTFKAASGLTASQVERELGFSAGSGDVGGALQSGDITETDLLNGAYDGATVETWLVDWSAPNDRLLMDIAAIGEIKRGDLAFSAELRSSAHAFDERRGRSYQKFCSADLGDARCGFDVTSSGFSTSGRILTAETQQFTASLADAFDDGFFTNGRLRFVGGANRDASFTVKSHTRLGDRVTIALWTEPGGTMAAGDDFTIVAGCGKSMATCRDKFSNLVNFRGFPHMPGNDHVIAYPSPLMQGMDGGSLFK